MCAPTWCVIYHYQSSESMDLLASNQYNTALIVAGCWKGTSKERHFRRLTLYYKIKNNLTPDYLRVFATQYTLDHTSRFQNSYFPYCYHSWKNLDISLKNSPSLDIFKNRYLNTIRPKYRDCFHIRDRYGISLLSKLRLDFRDLREHRFRHNFNCPSPDCLCGNGIESTSHFMLQRDLYTNKRDIFLLKLLNIIPDFTKFPEDILANVLIYSHESYSNITNSIILNETICFINRNKRLNKLEAFSNNLNR